MMGEGVGGNTAAWQAVRRGGWACVAEVGAPTEGVAAKGCTVSLICGLGFMPSFSSSQGPFVNYWSGTSFFFFFFFFFCLNRLGVCVHLG